MAAPGPSQDEGAALWRAKSRPGLACNPSLGLPTKREGGFAPFRLVSEPGATIPQGSELGLRGVYDLREG
jgi:hypothetical protein